jgi:hypothetical protein
VSPNDVHPSQPSGSVVVFLKPSRKKRRKKPGEKPGPKGSHRPSPENVTQHATHVTTCYPDCGGQLNRRRSTPRKRFLEDIPDDITPESTGHTIPQEDCPKVVADTMPGATIGHRAVVLSAFLHDLVGTADLEYPRNFHHPLFFQVDGGRIDESMASSGGGAGALAR